MNDKILVVDDNRLNIKLLQEILEDAQYKVNALNKSTDVLSVAKEFKPDAILLDIMMPELDGFDVCKLLQENEETKEIPIIMVTAKTDAEDLKKAFSLGAFDYVKKPIDEIELLARLHAALKFKEQQDLLKVMAMKDSLTGFYNHRLIIELLEKEYAKAIRNNECLAFLMIDIDRFKNVNDTYGHKVGDEVLCQLANRIQKNTRTSDIIGRYGGEEFCVILPDVSIEDMKQVCERIRRSICNVAFHIENNLLPITVSIGSCFQCPKQDSDYQEIMIQADKALYKAKNTGRNKTQIYVIS